VSLAEIGRREVPGARGVAAGPGGEVVTAAAVAHDGEMVCATCAAEVAVPAPLDWVLDRTDGEERWLCPDCVRRHVRDIESKLPHDWW
jgi:hypothetical protein